MEWMVMPLKRYADFEGRSRRKEYWMFTLLSLIIYVVVGLLFVAAGSIDDNFNSPFSIILLILAAAIVLALIVPSIAVSVRRFHDQDKSGWFYLLNFVPYVGGIIVMVFMCLEGTRGPNRFGADPKQSVDDVFS